MSNYTPDESSLPPELEEKPLTVLPPEKPKEDPSLNAIEFLLDRELRRELVNGKKWRSKKIVDLIHALGLKTVAEKEEDAEAERVAKLKPVSEPEND